MIRGPFVFGKRSQHPAHNEVNALLNLGYTLLANEIAGRLEAAGFDARVGFFHGVRYGRLSLALDLLEAHRVAVIDRLVLAAVNRRMMAPQDFLEHGDERGVRLEPGALRRFLGMYEEALGSVVPGEGRTARDRIALQIHELRAAVLEDGATLAAA